LWSIRRNLPVCVFLGILSGTIMLSSGHFENPDAQLRLSQAFSLIDNGTFQLADGVGNPSHGNIASNNNGTRYSVYGPGQIILFTPIAYLSHKIASKSILEAHYIAEILASFLGVAAHLITAIAMFYFAKSIGRTRHEAVVVSLVFAFATFNLPSARDGYEHTYEALLIVLSYTSAVYFGNKFNNPLRTMESRAFLASGLLLGLGLLFRPTTILALPGLMIICQSKGNIAYAAAGIIPGGVLLCIYNFLRFGSPIETGYQQAWLVANPGLISASGFDLVRMIPQTFALWVSPGKGMLFFSPILLALFLRSTTGRNRDPSIILAIATTVVIYSLFYGANFAWHGSAWSWGPRYLIPLTPLLILLIPIPDLKSYTGKSIALLVLLSVVIQGTATLTNYKRHLLTTYIERPAAFQDGGIFYDFCLSPLVALPDNILHLFQRLGDTDMLFTYFSPGPWMNEARIASIRTMLDSSIDLNSFDIWWIRLQHFPISEAIKHAVLAAGILSIFVFILCLKDLHRRLKK
jgi:hypothetical protein